MKRPNGFRGIHNVSLSLRRKILRLLIENKRVGNSNLDPEDAQLQLLCEKRELNAALNALEGSGYVRLVRAGEVGFAERNCRDIVGIELTEKGCTYFEQLTDERIRFFRNSVVVPMIISAVTAAVTVILTNR